MNRLRAVRQGIRVIAFECPALFTRSPAAALGSLPSVALSSGQAPGLYHALESGGCDLRSRECSSHRWLVLQMVPVSQDAVRGEYPPCLSAYAQRPSVLTARAPRCICYHIPPRTTRN